MHFSKRIKPDGLMIYTTLRAVMIYQACGLDKKKEVTFGIQKLLLFGPPGGIRTPDLQNRNLLRYPTSLRADKSRLCVNCFYKTPFNRLFKFIYEALP